MKTPIPTEAIWPLDVTLHTVSGKLAVLWSDGLLTNLSGDHLRNACRCAECEQQRRITRNVSESTGIALTSLQQVGDMGVQLFFSDGHYRGIFPWPYLRELSSTSCQEVLP